MTPSAIRLRDVALSYAGGPPVLEGLSLDAAPGDFVAITGPSGCGKSTLLRLLAGLLRPSEGSVLIDGKTPSDASHDLALVFQDPTLLPWSDALENASLLLRLQGLPKTECRERAAQALEMVRLKGHEHHFPRQLSGGQRMRVSLARALAVAPKLLLLDEPFGALDELTREHLGEELLALRERQPWTALFVTHSVAEAVFLANRVIVLSARPARAAHCVEITLPYPRTPDTRASESYLSQVALLTRLVRGVEGPEA
jgi:NitT/TauT family transport system ATP-binding protein